MYKHRQSGSLIVILSGVVVLGFGASAYILHQQAIPGASIALSFALPALLAAPGDVARLSAGTFAIGYSTAFLVTLVTGAGCAVAAEGVDDRVGQRLTA